MTTDVVCVSPDLPVEALAMLLLERGIGGVPVVDGDGVPIGVVSKTDLVRARRGLFDAGTTVGDIMMALAFTLPAHESIARASALMAFEGVHRIPVVSDEGKVAGLLSSLDVLRWLARHDGYLGQVPGAARDGARSSKAT